MIVVHNQYLTDLGYKFHKSEIYSNNNSPGSKSTTGGLRNHSRMSGL
jgi:hypothetical protein